jgi:hypothetical protein
MEQSMMQITYKVALEVATHEGIVRQTYRDSVGVIRGALA